MTWRLGARRRRCRHREDVAVLAVHTSGLVCHALGGALASGPLPLEVPDDATAYVLFTSGSTGKPKGCMVPHRGSALYARAVVEAGSRAF